MRQMRVSGLVLFLHIALPAQRIAVIVHEYCLSFLLLPPRLAPLP